MARRQAELLELSWPEQINAFLVTDCYDPRGAYSHPLTVDISHNVGSTLCETLLHEATHVADVHTSQLGQRSLKNNVMEHLRGTELRLSTTKAWNVWHATIFASSAYQVRTHIDPDHIDYALPRNLYAHFGVPGLPTLWERFATQEIDEQEFLAGIVYDLTSGLRARTKQS
ncbi:MAG TPA: hypothetical protein VFB60_18135 [Ktedonobacteraceae bacterium]|nr:hypothetical protein [Ktedonobacteraceae bacterium]